MDITMIFHEANIAKQLAGYLGIIETMDAKLDRLAGAEFEAAICSLEQAATSQTERDSLLREARSRFNKAISLENNERLALSYIGLALCHFQLGDDYNGREALRAISNIEMKATYTSLTKGALTEYSTGVFGLVTSFHAKKNIEDTILDALFVASFSLTIIMASPFLVAGGAYSLHEERKRKLEEFKDSVQYFLETKS